MGSPTLGSVPTIERLVIGRLVQAPARVYDLTLDADDFSTAWSRAAYAAIEKAATDNDPAKVDPVVIEATSGGEVDSADLAQLATEPCIDSVLEHHAATIRAKALSLRIRMRADEIAHSDEDGDALLARAMIAFNDLGDSKEDKSASLAEVQREVWLDMQAARAGTFNGVATGIKSLNESNAIERGGVFVLAGRPSMGKSAFALYMARHMSGQGERVLIFSTEMGRKKWARRFMAAESKINADGITTGSISGAGFEALKAGSIATSKLPIWIDDTSDRAKEICQSIRQHRQRYQTGIVIVDHLQECIAGKEPQRELAELLSSLRSVSREQPKTTLILLSQLNRGVESRPDKMPMMSDLRESGRIEEVADAVALCYRPHYYDHDEDPSLFVLSIAKNRDGRTGRLEFTWDINNGYVLGERGYAG